MLRTLATTAILLLLAAGLLAGCNDDDNPTTPTPTRTEIGSLDFDLASGGGDDPEAAGPVLQAGVDYVYTIEGTFSIWGKSMWDSGTCQGTAEAAPTYASPGAENDKVGVDAEFWFAIPSGSSLCDPNFSIPNHTSRVEVSLDGGTTWDHHDPVGGEPTAPTANHKYEYRVTGGGGEFRIRRSDSSTQDDYGVLKVVISRLD